MSRAERIPAFLNARGTFTRLEDAQVFKGWVIAEREPQFLVTFDDNREIGTGDVFLCELALRGVTVKLQAVAIQMSSRIDENQVQTSTTVAMSQLQTLSIKRSNGTERFRIREMTASVWTKAQRLASVCDVVDVSDSGVSLILPEHVVVGDLLYVLMTCAGEPLQFKCEVRYALAMEGGVRIGLLIHHTDRIVQSKWSRYISDIGGVVKQIAS